MVIIINCNSFIYLITIPIIKMYRTLVIYIDIIVFINELLKKNQKSHFFKSFLRIFKLVMLVFQT